MEGRLRAGVGEEAAEPRIVMSIMGKIGKGALYNHPARQPNPVD
jgi:hypothetical protein